MLVSNGIPFHTYAQNYFTVTLLVLSTETYQINIKVKPGISVIHDPLSLDLFGN